MTEGVGTERAVRSSRARFWRKPVVGVAVAALTTTITACGVSSSETGDAGELTFSTHPGEFSEIQYDTMISDFVEESGISVNLDSPRDLARVKVMVENKSVEWDVMFTEPHWAIAECGTLFEKVDFANIDKDSMLDGTYDECGIPINTYSTVMVYNKEKYKDNPPTKLADFYDTKNFPGTRMIKNGPDSGMLEMALHADGVTAEEMYPIDYDRAFKVLDRIKPNMSTWTAAAETQEALVSESVDMALLWSGRAFDSAKEGAPYEPVWDGNAYAWSSVTIIKGTKNKDAAQELVDHLASAKPQETFSETLAYGPANIEAKPNFDDERLKWEPSVTEHVDQAVLRDFTWWAEHEEEANERWLDWIQK